MSDDLYHYAQEQLSQAIQEQALIAQEDSIRASFDFIDSMIEIANMPSKPLTAEELDKIRQGILNDEEIVFCFQCWTERLNEDEDEY